MICFEIWINGERVCVAGAEDMRSIHASLISTKSIKGAVFMAGVDTVNADAKRQIAKWIDRELDVNDEIKLKIIESESPDNPESVNSFGKKDKNSETNHFHCSFCGLNEEEAGHIVVGFQANICCNCFNLIKDSFNEKA